MPEVLDDDFDPSEMFEEPIIEDVRHFLMLQGFQPMKLDAIIYALFLDDVCQYIGSTIQLYVRISRHINTKKFSFNKILIKHVNKDNMLTEESYLIGLLEPPFNTDGTSKRVIHMSKEELRKQAQILLASLRNKEPK